MAPPIFEIVGFSEILMLFRKIFGFSLLVKVEGRKRFEVKNSDINLKKDNNLYLRYRDQTRSDQRIFFIERHLSYAEAVQCKLWLILLGFQPNHFILRTTKLPT